MRTTLSGLCVLVVTTGVLLLGGPPALANWSSTYTQTFTGEQQYWYANGACRGFLGNVAAMYERWNPGWAAYAMQWTAGTLNALPAIPPGSTLVGGVLSVPAEIQPNGGAQPSQLQPEFLFGVDVPPWPSNYAGCFGQWRSGDLLIHADFSGTTQWQTLHGDAYRLIEAIWASRVPDVGVQLYPTPDGEGYYAHGESVAMGALVLQAQFAYPPSGLAVGVVPSDGSAQVRLSWQANGDSGDVSYMVQRQTLTAAGGSGLWTTIAASGSTTFTTSDQVCGSGYRYRVTAQGTDAHTGWDAAGEWDSSPCAVHISRAGTRTLGLDWSAVTPGTSYVLLWCASASCVQREDDLGAGVTSATLTGLTPNTAYTVWLCSSADMWDCAVAGAWTHAAVPANLFLTTTAVAGIGTNAQPLAWSAGGNPAGTVYQVRQTSYASDGAASEAWMDTGTALGFTAPQQAGGSYLYQVFAENAGYGGSLTAPSAAQATQVASTPDLTVTGPSTATLSWSSVWDETDTGVVCVSPNNTSWRSFSSTAGTRWTLSGLRPNTGYQCSTYAAASNQGIRWRESSVLQVTLAAVPVPSGSITATQTSLSAAWGSGGNPQGTAYEYVVLGAGASSDAGNGSRTAATTVIAHQDAAGAPIVCGGTYAVSVRAVNSAGWWTAWVPLGSITTVPCAPLVTGQDGGLGWMPAGGRGYVTLHWPSVVGANGYTLYVWDGVAYEAFDLGGATAWSSQLDRIFPADAQLYPNVTIGALRPPVLVHNGLGRDLRDLPRDLYCSLGPEYCSSTAGQRYYFAVAAYNSAGSSAAYQSPGGSAPLTSYFEPILPLQTDAGAPMIGTWRVNHGDAYTYGASIPFSLTASETVSGVAAYALSNDGTDWAVTALAGCQVGQPAACSPTLTARGIWTVLAGPGEKTVWAKVESTAGVWSAPQATTVYVAPDSAIPTVDVTLDAGAGATDNTSVQVAVSVSDPMAVQAAVSWRARYSTDGGQSWSPWQSEGASTDWTVPWSVPGGPAGTRTVLVQVENSDAELGQGGSSIYFAPPSGTGPVPSGAGSGALPCRWPVAGEEVSAICTQSNLVTVPVAVPAGAVQMRVSRDDMGWGPWQGTATHLPVNLGSAPGVKTVWLQFRAGNGAVAANAPLFYVYDPSAPTVTVSWAADASATSPGGSAILQVQSTDDAGAAGLSMSVTENGVTLYGGPCRGSLPLVLQGAGYQLVQVRVADAAGNQTSTEVGIYVEAG